MLYNRYLQALVEVAATGSFTQAAKRLHVSSTAVMKQLDNLENEVGCKLLERTHQGISLTEAGTLILDHAKFLISYSNKAEAEARRTMRKERHTLSLGSSILYPCTPFIHLLNTYGQQFKDWSIRVVPFEDSHRSIIDLLDNLGTIFDMMIGVYDAKTWVQHSSFLQLGTIEQCLAVPYQDPLAHCQRVTLSQLQGRTILIFQSGESPTVDRIHKLLHTVKGIHIEETPFYDLDVFNRAAKEGKLLVSTKLWDHVHPGLVTIPTDWHISVPYGILYAKHPSPLVQQLIELVSNTRIS